MSLSSFASSLVDPEHPRNREAPDVGVENTDPMTEIGDADGQVDRCARLPDATLTASHCDDPCRGRNPGWFRSLASSESGRRHQFGSLALRHGRCLDDDLIDAVQCHELATRVGLDLTPHRTLGDRESQPDRHCGVIDDDVSNHAEVNHV